MGGASASIEIKKRRLREEKQRPYPNQQVIDRLKGSISRHRKEMKNRRKWKDKRRENRKVGRMR